MILGGASAAAPGRATTAGVGEVGDASVLVIAGLIRVVRVLVLWIVVHFVDKVYQDAYFTRSIAGRPLPKLWTLPLVALAIEALAAAAILGTLAMLNTVYKRKFNSFVIDASFMRRVLSQYLTSTAVVAAVGVCFGVVLEHCRALRYKEDGARAVRALSLLFFYEAAIVVLMPFEARL